MGEEEGWDVARRAGKGSEAMLPGRTSEWEV